MKRPVTLKDFYAEGGLVQNSRTARPVGAREDPPKPARVPAPARAPVLTPAQRQAIVDGLVAAKAARRLAEFAGLRVTPGKLAGVALAALAAFGGYKWYKSRGTRRRKRRIKNSLLGE